MNQRINSRVASWIGSSAVEGALIGRTCGEGQHTLPAPPWNSHYLAEGSPKTSQESRRLRRHTPTANSRKPNSQGLRNSQVMRE
jgi:hypothetical protein